MIKKVQIRSVLLEDLEKVLQLCVLHAAYEQLPYQHNGQKERLKKDLFSEAPRLYCLVAVSNAEVVAYATYMKQYATWEAGEYLYLDCLFVLENFRSQGIGKRLMSRIKEEAQKMNCSLVQWQTPNFNERAMRFYYRLGAISKSKERFFLTI